MICELDVFLSEYQSEIQHGSWTNLFSEISAEDLIANGGGRRPPVTGF